MINLIIIIILILFIYFLFSKQIENKKNKNITMILPKILLANNEIKTSKEAYEQMTLVQKKIYLLRLFESNLTSTTPNSKEEKRILERQVYFYIFKKFYGKKKIRFGIQGVSIF
uniref:Uncharacterized protein n=1 Tax=Meloidogyne enterolobii TaxID=390850 RepID=A0A6V7UE72_MELEN|nr:unnamed protein product [Meloidogyne enterolobii]